MKDDISEMTFEDIAALVEVTKAHFNESKFTEHSFLHGKATHTLLELDKDVNSIVYVAKKENTIVGYIAASVFESPVADYISSCDEAFYVLPEWRKTYAAAHLIFEYIEWAKSRNVDYIMLSNNTYNDTKGVGKFLNRMGFELTSGLYTYKED